MTSEEIFDVFKMAVIFMNSKKPKVDDAVYLVSTLTPESMATFLISVWECARNKRIIEMTEEQIKVFNSMNLSDYNIGSDGQI